MASEREGGRERELLDFFLLFGFSIRGLNEGSMHGPHWAGLKDFNSETKFYYFLIVNSKLNKINMKFFSKTGIEIRTYPHSIKRMNITKLQN